MYSKCLRINMKNASIMAVLLKCNNQKVRQE